MKPEPRTLIPPKNHGVSYGFAFTDFDGTFK